MNTTFIRSGNLSIASFSTYSLHSRKIKTFKKKERKNKKKKNTWRIGDRESKTAILIFSR